jgi:1-pyrroline-5-carboxylate dehydrogenase
MSNAIYELPIAVNETVLNYAPGSPEKEELKAMLVKLKAKKVNIPMYIGGKKIHTKNKVEMHPPHEINHVLGTFSKGDGTHVTKAINAALAAKKDWENMAWQDRAAIFLKAADLLSGPYRARMNAATMLGQSKNCYQSEIDAVAEFCDFLRYNVQFMTDIYVQQPESVEGIWNRLEYRPLEGFVFAISPFNFTSIAGNLCAAPAMLGNTVVWKAAETQIYSAQVIMEIFEEAGLPPGVINLVHVDGPVAGDIIFNHPDFAGLHFTGSTGVFQHLWKTIGNNIGKYKTYPRIVGETGGKDFIVAHHSADAKAVATAMVRGSFEFQGQKCSASSRAYVPKSMWKDVEKFMRADLEDMKMGSPEDFSNYINAVIDERAFDKISSYIAQAKKDKKAKVIMGGNYSKEEGYFIEPTVILASDPRYTTMEEELFGPVLTVYVYDDKDFEKTLKIVDTTSPYALTGAIFAKERTAVNIAFDALRNAAGNFYINDKPTGAVVGQQPFGGGRASGTNDKAGSIINLYRWLSPRTIKETLVSATEYRYPFLGEE